MDVRETLEALTNLTDREARHMAAWLSGRNPEMFAAALAYAKEVEADVQARLAALPPTYSRPELTDALRSIEAEISKDN